MAERRKGKKKKDIDSKDLDKKPTKEEYAIARYLKQKLPEKKTTLLGHKVEYFISCKAVDCLLESPWAKNDKKSEVHFNNRDSIVNFMGRLLAQKLFHRAKKIVVQKDAKKKKNDEGAESGKEKESKKSKGKSDTNEKKDEKEGKKETGEVVEKKKEKKKIKLDMHLEQIFIDSNEPYVWIYDPIPIRTWITGTLMVVAAVGICLFPLWPQTIRHYIYYLSVAVAFFLVFIIGLAVFRLIFFVLVWVFTLGKHHIWVLPNLTEDVGFLDSFWPLYKYEYKGKVKDKEKDKESSSDKKHKEKEEPEEKETEKSDASSTDQEKKLDANNSESEESGDVDENLKGDNDFEIIDADDANESQSEDEDRKTK